MLTRAYLAGLAAASLFLAFGSDLPILSAAAQSSAPPPAAARDTDDTAELARPSPPSGNAVTGSQRARICERGLAELIDRLPIDFRAGDDDLKASVVRLVAGIGELSMRCPTQTIVIEHTPRGTLSGQRARRLGARLAELGVRVRIAPSQAIDDVRISLARDATAP